MTKFRFLQTGALGALISALLITGMPAAAQDNDRRGGWGNREVRAERSSQRQGGNRGTTERASRAERQAASPRQSAAPGPGRQGWNGRPSGEVTASTSQRYPGVGPGRNFGNATRTEAAPAAVAGRNTTYTAPRDRSYGAGTRAGWASQREAAQRQQRPTGTWAQPGDRRYGDRNTTGNRSTDSRRSDWQRDRRDDARRAEWRDDRRNYSTGYRDGRRDDSRYGNNHRRWDNRGWRADNRYDWYRYRASNRSLFSLGRYYSPYRNYSYSRVNIGFRLGSLFYGNRYWINDPWQYRLPAAYGAYRWVRYYDDALLVDTYSGEVVDVIHDFFW